MYTTNNAYLSLIYSEELNIHCATNIFYFANRELNLSTNKKKKKMNYIANEYLVLSYTNGR